MDKYRKLKYCAGCSENFYNGNNNLGIKECCYLKDAKVVWKKPVGVNERPPWKNKARRVLDCYRQKGVYWTDPKVMH